MILRCSISDGECMSSFGLSAPESASIEIIREVVAGGDRPVMLYSSYCNDVMKKSEPAPASGY